MSESFIVDSHLHLWDPARFRYPWLDGLPALNRAFLPADFAAASLNADVAKIILVECGCEPVQSFAEAKWFSEIALFEPRVKGIIAHAALEKGESVRADLARLSANPLVKGIRRNLQGERDPQFCLRPEFVAGLNLLAEFDLTFDLCIRHDQLPGAIGLVQRLPGIRFVLDHFGKPDVRGRNMEPWATDLKRLAALPNVVCKLSGLATEAEMASWQPTDLQFYFARTLEYFGFDRVLFGGDWPVATLATSYRRWLETVWNFVSAATAAARAGLFQTNAERIYRV